MQSESFHFPKKEKKKRRIGGRGGVAIRLLPLINYRGVMELLGLRLLSVFQYSAVRGAQLFNLCERTPPATLRGACLFTQTRSAALVLNLRAYFTGMSCPALPGENLAITLLFK